MTEKEHLAKIRAFVNLQAENEAIWLVFPDTALAAFLQQELRLLHAIIESESIEFIDDKIKNYND